MIDDTQQQTIKDEESEQEEVVEIETADTMVEELKAWENKYRRAIADYQNLEKRSRDERGDVIRSANRDLLLRFLPILDTLLIAGEHSKDQTLAICTAQFLDTLKSEGVTKLKTIGEKFDPQQMEVISTAEGKEGIVMSEVRAGFLLHDKLLRPAQVIVGQGEIKKEKEEKN
jgi:molecular chaperone GrpE